jgi:hypothetical protein
MNLDKHALCLSLNQRSEKVGLASIFLAGSILRLEGPTARRYIESLLREKSVELENAKENGVSVATLLLEAARDSADPLLVEGERIADLRLPYQYPPAYQELDTMLRQIDQGAIVLPQFQRNFEWSPADTIQLLVSVSKNYPAGSLLFLRHGESAESRLETRLVEGVERVPGHMVNPVYIVLDGQQRLTALYQALYGKGPYRYVVSLRELKRTGLLENSIKYLRNEEFGDQQDQFLDLNFPLSMLAGGQLDHVFDWLNQLSEFLEPEDEKRRKLTRQWLTDNLWKHIVETLFKYKFPVVELPSQIDLGDVCDIFEVLNKTGLKLTIFELLTARFWPAGTRLRDAWQEALEDIPLLKEFDPDPVILLQSVALLIPDLSGCGRRDLLRMQAKDFQRHWPAALTAAREALGILKGNCGVLTPDLLPYTSLLPALIATLAYVVTKQSSNLSGVQHDKLERWFWCSVFGETYEQATDTQNLQDFDQLIEWLTGGEEPTAVSEFRLEDDALYKVIVKNRSIYKGVLCLILRNQARDFANGEKISTELMKNEKIEDHHIFPRGYLKTKEKLATNPDSILNKTLIDASSNRRIRNKPPSVYMKELKAAHPQDRFVEILDSHFIPSDSSSPLWSDNYEAFIAARSERLYGEILKATGRLPSKSASHGEVVAEQIIRPGQRNLADKVLREWTKQYFATGHVVGNLMYIDRTSFAYLDYIPRSCPITLLIGGISTGEESKCLEASAKAGLGRPSLEISRMQYAEKPFSHERWLSNGTYEIELGTDLKESTLGKNEHTMRLIRSGSNSFRVLDFWEKYDNPSLYGSLARRELFFTSKSSN